MSLFRPKGISLLVPTQNVEQTVELCLRSFKDFSDEMIVVDNGSTDNTIDIVRSLESEIPNMRFYEAPHLKDLYENRQYAFERSRFNWIVRIDSDYVAYNSGENDIQHLRKLILNAKRTLRPSTFTIKQYELFVDTHHVLRKGDNVDGCPRVTKLGARIIQSFPGMRFQRNGRWEGVRFQKYLKKTELAKPYWVHCHNFKSKRDILYRSERTNWRELGDFKTFPTLHDYLLSIIEGKYGTPNIDEAAELFFDQIMRPRMDPIDDSCDFELPELLKGWKTSVN